MITPENSPAGSTPRDSVDTLIENLVDIGAMWARYGLTAGRSALEVSSKTLANTAEVLGEIAKRFEHERTQSR